MNFRTTEISDHGISAQGLTFVTVKSPALKRRVDLCAFAPTCAKEKSNLPLVILLHGVYGSHWAWALKGGAHQTLQAMVDTNVIPPMVLLMPSDGLWGDGSAYRVHANADYESWIVNEVPSIAHHNFNAVSEESPLFIAGLSMGGYGALRLGGKYPEKFKALSAHSSITEFDQLKNFVEEELEAYQLDESDKNDTGSVFYWLKKNKDKLPAIRFDCGLEDHLLEPNRKLHRQLEKENIAHQYQEFTGGHEWPYWQKHLTDTLRFFAEQL